MTRPIDPTRDTTKTSAVPRDARLLIFDLDGTLIDSRQDLCTAVNAMRRHYGLTPLPAQRVSSYIGGGIRRLVERSLEGAEIDVHDAVTVCYERYCDHLVDETTLYPGVEAGLRRLSEAGHRLAVSTNKPADAAHAILDHFNLPSLLDAVLGGGDTTHLKPHPEPLLLLMERTRTSPEATWMIGDHKTDIEAARRAGARSIFVTYGIGSMEGAEPTHQVTAFNQVVRFFVEDAP